MGVVITKEGNPECKHRWDDVVFSVDTFPPTRFYKCEICGRVEARTDEREAVKENYDM